MIKRFAWIIVLAAVAVVSYYAGVSSGPRHEAQAGVRGEPAPKAFKSGAARNEPLLGDIAATLRVMDGRLQNIERAVLAAQQGAPQQ